MTHPITPPTELVSYWNNLSLSLREIFVLVAQWGADQELEACCAIALTDPVCCTKHQRRMLVSHIQEQRRPKPPSLKEQALEALREAESSGCLYVNGRSDTIRRALKQLDD